MSLKPTEPAPRSRFARLRRIVFLGLVSLVPFWAVGQLARDWSWLTGLCFYIPSALLAAALLVSMLLSLAARQWRFALATGLLALPIAIVTHYVENQSSPFPDSPSYGLRLVHWNVGDRLLAEQQALLRDQDAGVIVLSEVQHDEAVESFRASLGPDYQAAVFSNLAVVGRGTVRPDGWLVHRGRFKVQEVTWTDAGRSLRLMVVDLPSEIHVFRDPLLREVNSLIQDRKPHLVVGDFNAPRRSRALSNLPAGYRHAYDAVGAGWGYTWPEPIPVYAIDQCIFGPSVTPLRYEVITTGLSDHRMQVFDFTDQ